MGKIENLEVINGEGYQFLLPPLVVVLNSWQQWEVHTTCLVSEWNECPLHLDKQIY